MKIEVTEGCVSYACEIDGKDYNEFTENELKTVVVKLLDKCSIAEIQHIIWDTVVTIGEWENLGHCDQCGDSIDRYMVDFADD